MPGMLHYEPVVTAIRGQAHSQQLKVLTSDPGNLEITKVVSLHGPNKTFTN